MKSLLLSSALLALAVTTGPVARAADSPVPATAASPETIVYDAPAAFAFIKTLAGEWERAKGGTDHAGMASAVTFRISAADSLVVETISPGAKNEMINTFYMDGDDLLVTHYCAIQNQPRMKFVKSDKPGEIKFEFHGGTNFDPAIDAHVHEGVYAIKDKDTVESAFAVFANGKQSSVQSGVIKRK